MQIGFVDPTDLQAYDDIARLVRREIDIAVVAESQLLALIDRVYRRTEEISGLAKELTADLGDVPVELADLLGTAPGAEEAPVVQAVADGVRRSDAFACFRYPHRAAGSFLARAFSYRRCFACADGSRCQDRLGAGLASEADVRAGYFGKALATGWPLRHQGAQQHD